MDKKWGSFTWDAQKEWANVRKHGVDFVEANRAFLDPRRKIFVDSKHSREEQRFFCIGKVDKKVMTVRFSYRKKRIRIIGAGYWRKGRKYHEKEEG